METKISISTITLCIASLQTQLEKMERSIAFFDDPESVPHWMYECVSDYNSAIDELKKSIEL